MTATRRKRGRPPSGLDGDAASAYRQISVRLPDAAREQLQALVLVTGLPQWRILHDAINGYVRGLDGERQDLVRAMIQRTPALKKSRSVRRPKPPARPVLCVDDNEAMLFARSSLLRNEGFEVVEARSGREALRVLETSKPSLVLLDVNLPDMSGLEVARQIKSDSRHDDVKVVQISATFNTPRDQLHGLQEGGADIYLAEPVPRGTLLSVIHRLLST
jgi:CheY-like chemotaxis protein